MTALQAGVILLAVAGGTAVCLTRDPVRQALVNAIYGFVLVLLFVVLQAPDVALSAMVVGSVAAPLMIALALARVSRRR